MSFRFSAGFFFLPSGGVLETLFLISFPTGFLLLFCLSFLPGFFLLFPSELCCLLDSPDFFGLFFYLFLSLNYGLPFGTLFGLRLAVFSQLFCLSNFPLFRRLLFGPLPCLCLVAFSRFGSLLLE